MNLLLELPLNRLSFGQISFNLVRECYKRNMQIGLVPIGEIDLSAYKVDQNLLNFIQEAINRRHSLLRRDVPTIKLWHLNGSDSLRTPSQTLLSCHETDEVTEIEKSICGLQNKTLFLGGFSEEVFKKNGCENVGSFSIGHDEDFYPTGQKTFTDRLHFGIIGKYEFRKNTKNIIRAWVKKYGNNKNYALTCLIQNPFFSPEDNQKLIAETLEGKRVWNCNFLPHLKTNEEMNQLYNAIDIDLSGASLSESWGIPAFTATCLGKWSIVNNYGGHKSWANKENSILIEPDGQKECYDGVFFKKGLPFNQGNFSSYNEDTLIFAMERAEKLSCEKNLNGLSMAKENNYSSVFSKILYDSGYSV